VTHSKEGEKFMSEIEKKIEKKIVTFSQIHEALEERQKPDRRQQDEGIPTAVDQDRRRESRRAKKPE
jgi:hypothetical protein